MSFTPAIPSLSAPMGASPKPTLVLDLEGVAGKEVKLHEWLDESDGSYYDCVVDWGDGTVERVNEDNFTTISHTYSDSLNQTLSENAGGGHPRSLMVA